MVICLFIGLIFYGISSKKVMTGTYNENIKIINISAIFYFITTSFVSISSMIDLYQQNNITEFIFIDVIYFVNIIFIFFYIIQLKFPFSEYCYNLRYRNKEEREEVLPF